MATPQLDLADEVLEELEQAAHEQGCSPEEFVQFAINQALRAHRRKMLEPELERQEAEAYRRMPVRPGEFAIRADSSWVDDPVEDAFWAKFYQEWLRRNPEAREAEE